MGLDDKARAWRLWGLGLAAWAGILAVVMVQLHFGQTFLTTDSRSYLNLADDLRSGHLPNLECYSDGRPLNPWPMAYSGLLALTGWLTSLQGETLALTCQALILALAIAAACKLPGKGLTVAALCLDSSLWLTGHAWSELLFVAGMLLAAAGIHSGNRWAFGFGALLSLHARQPALPSLLAGYVTQPKRKRFLVPLSLAIISLLIFLFWNSHYTGQLWGAPRAAVEKDYSHWLQATGKALLNEATLLRNDLPLSWTILQLLCWPILIWKGWPKSPAARFLTFGGLGYTLFTTLAHARLAFAEDLDARLLGPGTTLIVAGLLQGVKLKHRQTLLLVAVLLLIALPWKALLSQKIESTLPAPHPYKLALPSWAPPLILPARNPLTEEGVALGRALFHDKRLSGNGQMSCASCHRPGMAFAQRGVQRIGPRNTPSLLNVAWQPALFWDGGVTNLESVSLAPLHSSIEMGGNLVNVRHLLRTDPHYRKLVRAAFQTDTAQSVHILQALAQYQRTLISPGAPADKGEVKGLPQPGKSFFIQSCAGCHPRPLYTDLNYHRILPAPLYPAKPLEKAENGRYRITLRLQDLGAYKTPSLRNVALTAPFFHDGSVPTLEGCLNHGAIPIVLMARQAQVDTNQVRAALLDYLQSLTDTVPKT